MFKLIKSKFLLAVIFSILVASFALIKPIHTNAYGRDYISVGDQSIVPSLSSSTTLLFPVVLSATPTAAVSVHYQTISGSASSGTNFISQSGILTFKPGTNTANERFVKVIISPQNLTSNLSFYIKLSSVSSNAFILNSTGTGTLIANNSADNTAMSIGDIKTFNAFSGALRKVQIPVTLSKPSSEQVIINFATASLSAVAPNDYSSVSGMLTIPAGSSEGIISVMLKKY